MKNKKLLMTTLALILVCSISVAGTLAFLTASQNADKAVVNTFVAAGGGSIIDPNPTPNPPVIPEDLQDGFYLVESAVEYEDAAYSLDTATKVIANSYEKVVPAMTIPKDPALTVDLATGIDAYIFVKVIDTTGGNLTYTVADTWTEITVADLASNEKVYVYNNAITTGVDGIDLNEITILAGGTTENLTGQVVAADPLADTDTTTDGMQLGELKFEAYACQAGGFTDAADAFAQCF